MSSFSARAEMSTMESPAKVKKEASRLYIGLPKETAFQEKRIALTPDSVALLVSNGHRVVVESLAGESSHFYDTDYSEAGAEIANDAREVYQAAIVIKVAPPSGKEIGMLHAGQLILSPLHLPTLRDDYIRSLMSKKVTALAFEYIKDESNTYPIVRAMSEIAGSTCILIAAEYLSNVNQGKGVLMGGISGVPPVKVLILGAGVVGEFAAKTALGLGAEIKIFDNSTYKLMRLQNNIGRRVFTSVIQPNVLMHELQGADIAIGAIHSEQGRTPIIVTDLMVSKMKAGSVIIDVSIDQGGCFETSEVTSHSSPTFKKYDVIHYCVPNIPSRVSRTASYAISNILTPTLLQASESGGLEKLIWHNSQLRHGVYLFKGSLTNQHLSERFRIKYTDIELLAAANI